MPPSKLIVISLMLAYVFFCTLSLTMPIWGAELFSNIKDQLPEKESPTGLPVILNAPQPCLLCEGIQLQVTNRDLSMSGSTQTSKSEALKLAVE